MRKTPTALETLTEAQRAIMRDVWRLGHVTRGPRIGLVKAAVPCDHLDGRSLRGLYERRLVEYRTRGETVFGEGLRLTQEGIIVVLELDAIFHPEDPVIAAISKGATS